MRHNETICYGVSYSTVRKKKLVSTVKRIPTDSGGWKAVVFVDKKLMNKPSKAEEGMGSGFLSAFSSQLFSYEGRLAS